MATTSKIKVMYPVAIDCKFQENRLQTMKNVNGALGAVTSERFIIDGTVVSFCLGIYPNGLKEDQRGKSYIYLGFSPQNITKVDAKFTISIASANYFWGKTFTFAPTQYWTGETCCTTNELFDPSKRYIVNGEMNIKLDGYFEIEKEKSIEVWKFSECGDSLGINLWNDDNKDFTVIVDGKEIKTHKFIMCARSPVFSAMFRSQMKEAQENKVVIQDFTFDIVEAAIKLFYHPSLVPDTSFDDKASLLQFFDKYETEAFKDELEKFFISEINESNVCQLSNFSVHSNAAKLGVKCFEFLLACLKINKPVAEIDILDDIFAANLLKNAFMNISQ